VTDGRYKASEWPGTGFYRIIDTYESGNNRVGRELTAKEAADLLNSKRAYVQQEQSTLKSEEIRAAMEDLYRPHEPWIRNEDPEMWAELEEHERERADTLAEGVWELYEALTTSWASPPGTPPAPETIDTLNRYRAALDGDYETGT